MFNKKRWAAFALSLLLAVSMLAGCNTGGDGSSTPADTASSAPAESGGQAEVADGTYTVEVPGNSVAQKMTVAVTFAGGRISAIDVVDHGETEEILATVTELMVPRIIYEQSLSVDAITGATVSSVAIRQAVAQVINENGGNANDWYTEIPKSNEVTVLEGYDVIVVGLGGAGMTAYVSAAQNGATVFGMDSAGKVGGTSTTVSGPMAINPQTKMEEQNGGEKFLEEEDLIADWLDYTQGDAKEEMVRLFVNESGETMDWLIQDYDFTFGDIRAFFHPSGWEVWASYTGNKTDMYNAAMEKAKAANDMNDYVLELTAQELIVEDGEVVGVRAEYYDGTVFEVYGDAVILATGGFIGNADMKREYFDGANYNVEGMMQDNGAGIRMALEVGAGTYNISMPAMVHIAQTKTIIRSDDLTADQKAVLTALVLKPDSMIAGVDGTRFMSEAGNIAFDNWKGGDTYYAIYSEAQMQEYRESGMEIVASTGFLNQGGTLEADTPITDLDEILEVGERYNIVVKADTIEELADLLDALGLVEEVAAYNSYAAGTADPFGKEADLIHPLEEGPFYAILGAGYYYGTTGGLDIDENFNVLRTDGTAIENLYAVGQDSMGVLFTEKDAYVTYGGAAQGWVLTSGRLAGANAAEKYAG